MNRDKAKFRFQSLETRVIGMHGIDALLRLTGWLVGWLVGPLLFSLIFVSRALALELQLNAISKMHIIFARFLPHHFKPTDSEVFGVFASCN